MESLRWCGICEVVSLMMYSDFTLLLQDYPSRGMHGIDLVNEVTIPRSFSHTYT